MFSTEQLQTVFKKYPAKGTELNIFWMFVLDWIFLSGWQIKSYDYTIWFEFLVSNYKIDKF